MTQMCRITWYLNGLTVNQVAGESTVGKMLECCGKDYNDAFQNEQRVFDTIECHTQTKIGWQRRWVLNVNS